MPRPKSIDYQVTLRVSLGAAVAFADVMEICITDPRLAGLISPEWVPQIRKDIAAVRKQTKAQDPAAMAAMLARRAKP